MTKAQLVEEILRLDPTLKKTTLVRARKASLESRLANLQADLATPKPLTGEHDWRPVFDGPAWQAPDRPRWCAGCGLQVRGDKTKDAGPCQGPPYPLERELAVKAVKTFDGMEGTGFSCTLYVDGQKLGNVYDDARGGCMAYQFNWKAQEDLERWARVKTQQGFEPLDKIVNDLVADELERRWLKRTCKKKTVVKAKGHGVGEWDTYAAPYSAKVAAQLREKLGDDLVEIANEREGL